MTKPATTVIALGSAKGGSGKTTLATCLAVEAAKTKRAVLIDADPQQSAARWHELRRNNDDSNNPGLFRSGTEPLGEKADMLRRAGADWVFIDLPPGDLDLIEEGIAASDFVVIPIRASPLDIEAIGPIKDICDEYGKAFGIVHNAHEPNWKISGTVAPYCKAMNLPLLNNTVGQRQAYTGSMVAGETGPEYHDSRQAKVCADEITALWREISKKALAARTRG